MHSFQLSPLSHHAQFSAATTFTPCIFPEKVCFHTMHSFPEKACLHIHLLTSRPVRYVCNLNCTDVSSLDFTKSTSGVIQSSCHAFFLFFNTRRRAVLLQVPTSPFQDLQAKRLLKNATTKKNYLQPILISSAPPPPPIQLLGNSHPSYFIYLFIFANSVVFEWAWTRI